MNSMQKAFESGPAFIPFITCGDPSITITEQLVYAMDDAGADLIELGIPFSDPTAEGPTIQAASIRALSAGTTTHKIFEMVRRIREKTSIPLAFMTYANVVFSFGIERFIQKMAEVGVQALILPDVPYEEKDEFAIICQQYSVHFISLIAPTSGDRIHKIARDAEGFIYCVSSLGVTGVRTDFSINIKNMIQQIKKVKNIPCTVGFGISSHKQAKAISSVADGIIVGSAIVALCEKYGEDCVPYIKQYVTGMKSAISANS